MAASQLLVGDRDDAEAVGVERGAFLLCGLEVARVEGADLVADLVAGADGEDLLDRAFADENVLAVLAAEHDRQAPAVEVERNLVDLAILMFGVQLLAELDVLQHRDVEQVLQARLVVAVEVGVFEHALAVLAPDVEVALEDDPVLGQRAGLVGAQHVHGAEVLDRVQALDDHLLARHRERALGEVHGHDHRQHLRRQADRDGEREQQRLEPVALGEPVDQEHRRHHDQHEADHQPGEAVDALVEAGLHPLSGDGVGELAEIGAAPVWTMTPVP